MPSSELDVRPKPSRIPAHPSITREQIALLVDTFYERVRSHPRLGPVFENTIDGNWDPHLEKMKLFWASVLLRSGDYKGKPVPVHMRVRGAEPEDFKIWLEIFRPVAREIFHPDAAGIVIEAAERIAQSLWLAMFGSATSTPPSWMQRSGERDDGLLER